MQGFGVRGPGPGRRRGVVIVICLMVLGLLSILAIAFATMMRIEVQASQNYLDGVHAEAAARVGLDVALHHLRADAKAYNWFQGRPSPWHRLNGSVSPYGIGGKAGSPNDFEADITNEDGDDNPATGRAAMWRYVGPLSNLNAWGIAVDANGTTDPTQLGATNLTAGMVQPKALKDISADGQYLRFAVQIQDLAGRVFASDAARDGGRAGGPWPTVLDQRQILKSLFAAVNGAPKSIGIAGLAESTLVPDSSTACASDEQIRALLEDGGHLPGGSAKARENSWDRLRPFLTAYGDVDAGTGRAPLNVNTASVEALLAVFNTTSLPSLATASPDADGTLTSTYGGLLTLGTCQGQLIAAILKKRNAAARANEGNAITGAASDDAYVKIHDAAAGTESTYFSTNGFQDMDDWEDLVATLAPKSADANPTGATALGRITEKAANDVLNNIVYFYGRDKTAGDKATLFLPPPNGTAADATTVGGSRFAHDRELIKVKPGPTEPPPWTREPADFRYKYDFDAKTVGSASAWTSEPDSDLKEYGKRATGEFDSARFLDDEPVTVELGFKSRIFEILVEAEVVYLNYDEADATVPPTFERLASRRLCVVVDRGKAGVSPRFLSFRWITAPASGSAGSYGGTANVNFANYPGLGY